MSHVAYDDAAVQRLFDRMGPSYDIVNPISSFGFSSYWRKLCVWNASVQSGDRVCDMMAGSGECWPFVLSKSASLVSIDFSQFMVERQQRRKARFRSAIDIRHENALATTLADESIDVVVAAFGLKTLTPENLSRFACEIRRILKPGGRFSLLEISDPRGWWLGPVFRWYLRSIIPWIGRLCLGDIECYRMLSQYTEAFGSCEKVVGLFAEAGLSVEVKRHFFGCATSLVGSKTQSDIYANTALKA